MKAETHLEKVIAGETSAVTYTEKVITGEAPPRTYLQKVIAGEAPPRTHLQRVIAGVESPVTHLEYVWAGGTPTPPEREYTGAVPVTFVADGTPLLDYIISGNTVQSGTPTPDSPVMPQGTGERTGNLFDYTRIDGVETKKYINQSGEKVSSNNYNISYPIEVLPNQGYIWSFNTGLNALHTAPTVAFYDSNDNYISVVEHNSSVYWFNFTTPNNCKYIRASVYIGQNNTTSQLLVGSSSSSDKESLPYEPFGVKIPISSANTTTPVYLGEIESTRRIKKLVLTGEETITFASEDDNRMVGFFTIPGMGMKSSETGYCNILQWKNSYSQSEYNRIVPNGSTRFYMSIAKSALPEPTFEGFIAYLAQQYAAGTPVTVWYVLATEETAVVNEPLMKIGDYADTLSMEQAGVQIPTANGSTTLNVETTVPPSEVYIKYKGV